MRIAIIGAGNVGGTLMANPVIDGVCLVMLVCGDDEALKPTILKLVGDVGFEAVDAGKLAMERQSRGSVSS